MTSSIKPGVLLTGGLGYIGSHVCVALMERGYDVVVLDNLSNCELSVLDGIRRIVGKAPTFLEADVRDRVALARVFAAHPSLGAVMHFAALKAVGESVAQPLAYYDNNVTGSLSLLSAMQNAGVRQIVFSSSATVYGANAAVPITEAEKISPINPYGHTKATVEQILLDLHSADPSWRVGILRYFNPAGAHLSGLIGEYPRGTPNNLFPYIAQVASGTRAALKVFGQDYPTVDGTGVRDYIHVTDLATGHISALEYLAHNKEPLICNLGRGQGHSVMEVIRAFEQACGRTIKYEITPRRPGDAATVYASATRAAQVLRWQAALDLSAMCQDTWRWVNRPS